MYSSHHTLMLEDLRGCSQNLQPPIYRMKKVQAPTESSLIVVAASHLRNGPMFGGPRANVV